MAVTIPIKITWMIEALVNHLGIVCPSVLVCFQATRLPKDTTATLKKGKIIKFTNFQKTSTRGFTKFGIKVL